MPAPAAASGTATLALRPEKIRLVESSAGLLTGTISDTSFLGDQVVYTVRVPNARRLLVKERNRGNGALRVEGARVGLTWRAEDGVLLGSS